MCFGLDASGASFSVSLSLRFRFLVADVLETNSPGQFLEINAFSDATYHL